jgi:mobilization protein
LNERKIRDNGAKASIHFQKAEQIAFFHNSREAFLPETSNEELRPKNECDRTAEEARQMFEKLSAQGDENFLKNCGRRTNMKAENKLWESVMNLREHHTLEDVQRVNARIQKITGFIPIQTSLHRDEGHVDSKTGDFVQNIHAQTTWLTQDPETGKSQAYLLFGRKDIYRKIQDIVAEELGMERGQSAEITGAKHFRNMRTYKEVKRAETAKDKEWEQKLAANNAEWEARKAEWEQKQAEREARQAEWEKKLPEIIAARERRSKYISEQLDWEHARTGKMLAREMQMLGLNFAGVSNPQGNILIEAQKDAIRNIFYMLGVSAQLAVVLLKKTIRNDEKLAADVKIYNVESTLLRAVDYVANSDPANSEELKKRIQRTFRTIPEDKREELFLYALENAPTEELKNDIKALIEGRFSDIAKSEAAQRHIENRDLRAELREYSEEIRKIKDELREMDEENRILNAAERAILREKGAGRSEYAEQEAQNKARQEEIQKLKDEQKALKKTIDDQKQSPDKDAETIRRQAEKIAELTAQIAKISAENIAKQKELEAEKQIITPKMLEVAFEKIDELEGQLKELKEREEPIREPEPVKPEPKPEQIEPKQAKADDNLNIFGYARPTPEPRRRFSDDYERKTYDDRPRYEPIREPEPEKIEPREPEKPKKDEWEEIEEAMEKWQKSDDIGEKAFMTLNILAKLNKYDQNGKFDPEKRAAARRYRFMLDYDPVAAEAAERARKQAERERRERERELELERKRQAEIETSLKYEEVKKNVRQEADARQTALKKKEKRRA